MRALAAILFLASPAWGVSAINFVDRNQVTSPSPFQVFQRSGSTCTITVSGSVLDGANAHTIEANVDGGGFSTIQASTSTTYSGSLTSVATGTHLIRIRYQDTPQKFIDIPTVGCGDLFVIAGQSNAVGQTTTQNFYKSGTSMGLSPFASMFGGDYAWHTFADKTGYQSGWVDSVNSNVGNVFNSVWPLLATQIIANQGVPIGFIPCSKDSSAIADWLPAASHTDRTTLYGACTFRAQQVSSKIRNVLWWQGETEAAAGGSGSTYTTNLQTLADAWNTDLSGAVLVPTRIHSGANWTSGNQLTINNAMSTAHTNDSAHIAVPADLSNLYADDGAHLQVDANVIGAVSGSATVTLWSALKTANGW